MFQELSIISYIAGVKGPRGPHVGDTGISPMSQRLETYLNSKNHVVFHINIEMYHGSIYFSF